MIGQGGVGGTGFGRGGIEIGHGCEVHGPGAGYGGHVVATSAYCDPRAVEFVNQRDEFLNR